MTESQPQRSSNSGGAATNAGIDFQQRVAALMLTCVFTEVRIETIFGVPIDSKPTTISFEPSAAIDDMVVACQNDQVIYFQAKRSLSVSTLDGSDFHKTLRQFVRQFIARPDETASYVLATSPNSSGAITRLLRKLLDRFRLSESGPECIPLSKAERKILETFSSLLRSIFRAESGHEIDAPQFKALTKRIFISVLSVEAGLPHESAALALLTPKVVVDPNLIWAMLVQMSLKYSAERAVVDVEALSKIIGKYKPTECFPTESKYSEEHFKIPAGAVSGMGYGREVVLIQSLVNPNDLMITECYRFDKACRRRLRFSDSRVMWAKGDFSKLYCRASTFSGIQRFIESNTKLIKGREIQIIPYNIDFDPDQSACAKAQAAMCEQQLKSREKDLFRCIHCGKSIVQEFATLVELDDEQTQNQIGCVHDECLRSIDRILGRLQCPDLKDFTALKNFDFDRWVELVLKGQRYFGGKNANELAKGRIVYVGWHHQLVVAKEYRYCLRANLEEGQSRFITSRGKLERLPKYEAELEARKFNAHLESARQRKDPLCYGSVNWMYGPHSRIISLKESDEEALECLNVEVVPYSEQIGREYPSNNEFYTPLCYLSDLETEHPIIISETLFLFSNPLTIKGYIKSLREASIEIGEYEVRIIGSDAEFDHLVHEALNDELHVLIDARLSKSGEVVSAFEVCDIDKMASERPTSDTDEIPVTVYHVGSFFAVRCE